MTALREARGSPPDRRAELRQVHAAPVFDDLEVWLAMQLATISGKSPLAAAIRYALARMERLRPYLDNGTLELDNNAAERGMRAIALGRKNYLFVGSEAGGKAAAIAYTLIETAKLNVVDPHAWLADIRDIMLEAVECRFSAYHAPSVIEILTDNGSPYIAKETQIFARQLGLKPCFTPVQSPQSNGISEAFVKTLKRDYVQVTPLPDAQTVLGLIGGWIEDYNENHPHSGLKSKRWLDSTISLA